MSFGDDRSKTTTAKVPAHLRNETESARTIATFGNLYERVVRWCRQHTRRRFVVEIRCALIADWYDWKRASVGLRIANSEYVVDLTGADEGVNFRYLSFQFFAITFDQTTRDDESLRLSICFKLSGFEDRLNRFFFR